ncbi:Lrp/AsnC family transcriptional regulator [Saccharopolyspora sp. 6M]|uniref:Lrp/AsnC family transcriptional regulator n=1 Tax=Saccharopolyspora sp. 6M TaxID=2877237 RepID=UPI001CD1AF4A|nr:Lrp/AsnC family transcriptional regulator [Saccharopolyspora sp. 6M]MCA1226251.1 Lrp/AsnC family transcriptional regulator [Saccharopolyspora sp. 6M]
MNPGHRAEPVDEVDRRIIAALQLNGRAPWSAIARWAGASETTVQRRFTALLERGLVRVVGVIDLDRTAAGSSMLVRIQAKPGTGWELAELLAAHPEARFLAVVTGTADLIVDFVAHDNDQLLRLLFTDLPGAGLIAGTESVAVIRTFTTAPAWDTGLLPDEAADDLRRSPTPAYERADWGRPPRAMGELERSVAEELARDGRLPISVLARRLGCSESGAARALDRLLTSHSVQFRTLVEPGVLGYGVEFMLWLSIHPGRLDAAGRQLAAHPGTKFLAAATGRFNLVGQMVLPAKADLFRYTDEVIGTLPGLHASDITLHLATLKRAWTPVGGFERPRA